MMEELTNMLNETNQIEIQKLHEKTNLTNIKA